MRPLMALLLVAATLAPGIQATGLGGPSSSGSHPLLVKVFYYNFRDDEFVAVHNPAPFDVDLSGWRVTDGEGSVAFPTASHLPAGATVVATTNGTVYWQDTLEVADFAITGRADAALEVLGRRPALSNLGDEVFLLDPAGAPVDAFVFGESSYMGPGWTGGSAPPLPQGKIAIRQEGPLGYIDTDGPSDWESQRLYGLGQSDWSFRWTEVRGSLTAFVAPDNSLDVLKQTLDGASRSIYVNAYEWSNPGLTETLRSALGRG